MKTLKEWVRVQEEEYKKEHPPDFITHYNYINYLSNLANGLSISCNLNIKSKILESKTLMKKARLLALTLKSISAEYKTLLINPDYAVVCVPWISVKCYYLFFNLLLILRYLITGEEKSFYYSHDGILKCLKEHLKKGELVFNKPEFNKIYSGKGAWTWKAKPHANVKIINPDLQERFFQIIKILMRYRVEEFKRREKVKTLNFKKGKKFLDESNVNICEFFYWYRIKANYRDLEFLDKDIENVQYQGYYKDYYFLIVFFYKAFEELINKLSMIRLGRNILN